MSTKFTRSQSLFVCCLQICMITLLLMWLHYGDISMHVNYWEPYKFVTPMDNTFITARREICSPNYMSNCVHVWILCNYTLQFVCSLTSVLWGTCQMIIDTHCKNGFIPLRRYSRLPLASVVGSLTRASAYTRPHAKHNKQRVVLWFYVRFFRRGRSWSLS